MRAPDRQLVGNLRFTRTGTVWADFLLQPLPYGFRPGKDKEVTRKLHQALLRALPGESLLLGISSGLDPMAVVERMIAGIDLETHRDWALEAEASLHTLEQIGPGQRLYWLSVPLADSTTAGAVKHWWQSAAADLRDQLALPRRSVTDKEIQHRQDQVKQLQHTIPAPFRARPATPAQMLWLHLHASQRGLFRDTTAPDPDGGDLELVEELLVPRAGASLPDVLLDEGGQTDLSRTELRGWTPHERRYLKVVQAQHGGQPVTSYQSFLVLTDVPAGGMRFPGGTEFFSFADHLGFDVDWALRLQVLSSETVIAKNQRALVNLNEQFSQREGELSHGLSELDQAATDLAEYAALLQKEKLEVEVQATTVFAVAAPTPEQVSEQAQELSDYFGGAEFRLSQPLGGQTDLWWAMTPGAPTSKLVREFAQITTSRAMAASVPITSSDLGDRTGPLFALNISNGRPGVVLHDIAGAATRDISGACAFAGELGSGKSSAIKTLAGAVVDRGGILIAADRTVMGEYEVWANEITDAVVVNVADPQVSLDPLRLFGIKRGSRVAQSFLTPLLNVAPTSAEGVLLSDVLDPPYLKMHDITGLGHLVEHLADHCDLPGAADLARLMNLFARGDLGQVIFDPSLPPLPLDTPAIVIRTHTLELPGKSELEQEHLFQQMRLEKIFGRACYALIASLAREVCFADRSRLGVFVVDEAHFLVSSPEGEREIIDFVRDGRKHSAAVILGSHDPQADFGSPTLRGLIPTRILMRHRDKTLARRGLAWLDLDQDDPELIEMITEHTSPVGPNGVPAGREGEAFMRDSSGNIGRIKILLPSRPERNQAARTSPPQPTDQRHRPGQP